MLVARHPSETESREEARVYLWRYKEALAAGMTKLEARLFAESELELEGIRHLKSLGCPRELFARILL